MKAKNMVHAIHDVGTLSTGNGRVGNNPTTTRVPKGGRCAPSYPRGSIGGDLAKRNYVRYLVGRYHDYRDADTDFGRMEPLNYAALFKNIEAKFKAPTYFIPANRFPELVDYL